MLSELQKHMPQRTLKLSYVGDVGLLSQITKGTLGIVIAGGLICCVFFMVQPILKDRKMIDNWVSVPTAQVIPFSDCSLSLGTSVKKNIFSYCNVKIIHNGQTIERSFRFFDFSGGDYNSSSIKAIAQKDDPSNMNVDLAIDKMSNRMIFVVLIAMIALVLLLFAVINFRAIPYQESLIRIMNAPENQPWEFVAIPATVASQGPTSYITEVDGNSGRLQIGRRRPIVLVEQGRKLIMTVEPDRKRSVFRKSTTGSEQFRILIAMFKPNDASLVLGIKAKSQNTTVVLCKKLENINFTEAEKKQLLDNIKSV